MTDAKSLVPAALYLRMSTEHQQYSLENQSMAIRKYADSRGFEVVQTYSDAARSGLVLKRRAGLRQRRRDFGLQQHLFVCVRIFRKDSAMTNRITECSPLQAASSECSPARWNSLPSPHSNMWRRRRHCHRRTRCLGPEWN